MSHPSPIEVARSLVEGLRADERGGHVADFDAELIARIAHVLEGERMHARYLFDFYAMPNGS